MAHATATKTKDDLKALYSQRGQGLGEPRIGDPQKAADLITFTYGYPDAESLPNDSVAASTSRTLVENNRWALQYGRTGGVPVLVDVIREKLARDQGIEADFDQVMITSGGSQAVQLLLDLLVDWGDTIIVEAPTWMGFLYAARNVGAQVVSIPLDDNGTDVVALEATLKDLREQGVTPKLIYIISNFQNPSGITTTLDRRKRIVELAQEYGTLILEDDAYHDLRYAGEKIPSIYSLDKSGSTIYLGTLSKIMGAGMRIGWLVGPNEIMQKLSSLKIDGCTNVFGSYVAADWIPDNLDDHIDALKSIYQTRRDAMLDALSRYMPAGATWTEPQGGFFIWLTLPDGVNTTTMLPQSRERGVEYLPGATCYSDGTGNNQMRLSFSFSTLEQIERGISILGEIIKGELQETGNTR